MGRVYSFLKKAALTLLPDRILAVLKSWHYRRVLRRFPDAEEPDLIVVRKLVETGSTAVDLGANIGVYTKALSETVGPRGRVLSVEPIPQTFALLSSNVRSLQLPNVECVNVAVSDADGEAVMEIPDGKDGGTNFYQARLIAGERATESGDRRVRVPTVTLDTLLAVKGDIGFVKCDVEGYELACLRGARRILDSHSPGWLVEVSGDPDEPSSNAAKTFEVFGDHSYAPWFFDGRRLRQRQHGDKSTNYFFLRPEHVSRLRRTAPGLLE